MVSTNSPMEAIICTHALVLATSGSETGASAIKFRVGGMLSNNRDSVPGRSEALIPMVREAFGDHMTIYADSNSSYDANNAIRLGRMMQEHDYGFSRSLVASTISGKRNESPMRLTSRSPEESRSSAGVDFAGRLPIALSMSCNPTSTISEDICAARERR